MQKSFYIDISIRAFDGLKRIARFELGEDRETAAILFGKLEGSSEINLNDMLYIEFMELVNGLPMNIDILTCDLQQLGTNCMVVTRELFRLTNLKTGI